MTVFDWATTRDRAIERFRGDHPGARLEETILNHFEREPQRVIDTIEQIGRSIERGGPNVPVSGWAVLAKNLTTQPLERQVTDHAERTTQLAIVENWLRNAGGNIDRESELISELYDPSLGRLRHWPDTQPQIVALWLAQRPRFEQMEAEAIQRQARQAAALKRLRPRSKCRYCSTMCRSDTGVCAEHRYLLEEDHRYTPEPPDDAYLDSIAPDRDA